MAGDGSFEATTKEPLVGSEGRVVGGVGVVLRERRQRAAVGRGQGRVC